MTSSNFHQLLRFLFVVGITIVTICLFFYITKYTYPFIIALVFTFIINPFVRFLTTRLKINRSLAVFVSIFLLLTIISGIITFLIIELIQGTSYLAEHIPAHFTILVRFFQEFITQHIIPIYHNIASMIHTLEPAQQQTIMNNMQHMTDDIAATGANLIRSILQKIPVLLSNLPSYITVLVFALLGTFFISKDWYKLIGIVESITPTVVTSTSRNILGGLKKAFIGFIKAQLTLISMTAFIILIGLIILRIDYAVTIAVITGVIDLIPYLGTGFIFIPWIIYMFITGNYFLTIGLSILYITVVVQRQLMEPKVLSNHIGLNPLATLIALFVGFEFWGLAGLIVGPVLLVVLNTLYQTGTLNHIWHYIKGS